MRIKSEIHRKMKFRKKKKAFISVGYFSRHLQDIVLILKNYMDLEEIVFLEAAQRSACSVYFPVKSLKVTT